MRRPLVTTLLALFMIAAFNTSVMAQDVARGSPSPVPQTLQECRQELRNLTNEKNSTIAGLEKEVRGGNNGFWLIVTLGCLAGLWLFRGLIEGRGSSGRLATELDVEKRTNALLVSLLKSRKPVDELFAQVEGSLRTSRDAKAAQERHARELDERLGAQVQNLGKLERRLIQLEKRG